MENRSAQIIRRMIAGGYAAELRALLLGESTYNSPSAPGLPSHQSARRLRTDALLHLDFIVRTGRTDGHVEEDGKFYRGYPVEFEEWIRNGAPGVTEQELLAFAEGHPDIVT